MIKYYSEVGSYRGCIKIDGRWISIKNLNYLNKRNWHRHQGPPTASMIKAMSRPPVDGKLMEKEDQFDAHD